MADFVNGQQAPEQGGTQPNNGQAGTTQPASQSSEPTWLSYVPETDREEARKSYMLHKDYTQKTQGLSEKEKQWETEKQSLAEKAAQADQFTEWYQKSYQPFYNQVNSKWDVIQKVLTGQPLEAPQANVQQQDYFANYDLLPPTEQAKKLAEYSHSSYLAPTVQAAEQRFYQYLQQREGYYANYMNILTDALVRKMGNPDLDLTSYLTEAMNFQAGKGNPLDLAYQKVTSGANLKALEDQWYKKGKEDAKVEHQNQLQSTGAMERRTVPLFKQQAHTKAQIEDVAREAARKSGISW